MSLRAPVGDRVPAPPSTGVGRASPRGFVLLLLAVAAAGLVLRVVYVFAVAPKHLGADAVWYDLVSGPLAKGQGYLDPAAYYQRGVRVATANFPPLWPLVLAGAHKLGIEGQRSLEFVGSVIGSVTIVLAGLIGRRVAGATTGIVAAVLVAASPLLVAADGSLMAESLAIALVTAAVLTAYATIASPAWYRFVILGVLVGAATLARSDGIAVGGAVAAVALWRAPLGPARTAKMALVAVAAFAIVLAPWVVRNATTFDEPVLLSNNSGSLIAGANCDTTYHGDLLGTWDPACAASDAGSADPADTGPLVRRGARYALDHVTRLPLVGVVRIARAWGVWDPGAQAALESVETRSEGWQVAGWAYASVVVLLGVAGLALLVRRRVTVSPLVATVVAVTAVVLVSWGNQRFRLAAEPSVAVLAAAAVAHLVGSRPRGPEPVT